MIAGSRPLLQLVARNRQLHRAPQSLRRCLSSTPPTPRVLQTYSTPIARELAEVINANGPITLAQYMRQCLTSASGGYYTAAKADGSDPFGRKGDFVTSPEISQLFGEMVGLWLVTEWMKQGRRKEGVQLIELGPGRGTLMDDVLRTLRSFKALTGAIESVYMIEASPELRKTQAQLLCNTTDLTTLPDGGFRATSKYSDIPITWYDSLTSVPKAPTSVPFVLAHEFFDALPIHAFEATKSGWRELMVAHNPPGSKIAAQTTHVIGAPTPEFSLAKAITPTGHSMLLPELSERYKKLKTHVGSMIEISPDSMTIVEDMAKRIGTSKAGAALIIDYGPLDTIPVNSLRGIRSHRMVSPFSNPGETDVSADVDFFALAERALVAHEDVEVHGPVEQGHFLLSMGMQERLKQVLKELEGTPEETKKLVVSGFERLTERHGGAMGKVYKAMAIVPERGGKRPVGFGGQSVEQ